MLAYEERTAVVTLTRTQIDRLHSLIPNLHDYCDEYGDVCYKSHAYKLGLRFRYEIVELERAIWIAHRGTRKTFTLTAVQLRVLLDRMTMAWEIAADNALSADDRDEHRLAKSYKDGVYRLEAALKKLA